MLLGTGIAILLRVLLTLIASAVLRVPLLKLIGGAALTVIAIKLAIDDRADPGIGSRLGSGGAGVDLSSVIATVVVADLVMSIDNVVALAAVADGSVAILALGLLLSVPLLMFGSWHISAWLERYPALTQLGGAMLGWFAGDIAVSDPLYAEWVHSQSPALRIVVPALVALYVLLQSRIVDRSRASAAVLRPARVYRAQLARAALPQSAPSPSPVVAAATVEAAPVSVDAAQAAVEMPAVVLHEVPAVVPELMPELVVPELGPPLAKPLRGTYRLWWQLAGIGGAAAIAAAAGLVYVAKQSSVVDLPRYDCPTKDVTVFFRPGGRRIRITSGATGVNGVLNVDNQIDWGDYHSVSALLGFVPPTHLLFGDSQSIRIDGGAFESMTCNVH
jgi:YjbE family integral membrane protein